jgi:hypothetical protein
VIIVTWIVAIVIAATLMMIVLAVGVRIVIIIVGRIVIFIASASQGGPIVEAGDDSRAIAAELEQVPCFLERARCHERSLRGVLEVRQELTDGC